MYPEFIGIYVLLAVAIVLSAVSIILQIVHIKNSNHSSDYSNNYRTEKASDRPTQRSSGYSAESKQVQQPASYGSSGVVFCKSCATQFDARHKVCPRCGTTR